ncbi:MAG: DUF3017 domain-containing protein [Kineosporiaceae bacterium]
MPIRWEVAPSRRTAFVVVLGVVALSVVVTLGVDFRVGGYVLALALVLAAGFRAFLPARLCLGLLIRSRRLDVTMSLVLAAAVAVLARSVPG